MISSSQVLDLDGSVAQGAPSPQVSSRLSPVSPPSSQLVSFLHPTEYPQILPHLSPEFHFLPKKG